MTIEQIEAFAANPILPIIAFLALISCAWYYFSHTRKAIKDPAARTPRALAKNFLVGSPLKLLLILIGLILILSAINLLMGGSIGGI